jgi:hypothetical protein
MSNQPKKNNSKAIINALNIGIMIGVVFWSATHNTLGFFTIIPIFIIYKIVTKEKKGDI